MTFLVFNGWSDFFSGLWQSISTFWFNSTGTTPYIYNVIAAILWAVLAYIFIKIILTITRRGMKISKFKDRNKTTKNFFYDVIRILLYLVAFVIFLSLLRVDMSGMSTIFSSAIVALGLSLQGVIGNFASGMIILSSHFFKIGDYILIKDCAEGTVLDVRFLYTVLQTVDGQKVLVNNSSVASGVVTNYSVSPTRRMNIALTFSYKEDPELIRKELLKIVETEKLILRDPKPQVIVNNLDSNGVTYNLRCYSTTTDYWDILYSLNEKIVKELNKNEIKVQSAKVEFVSSELIKK